MKGAFKIQRHWCFCLFNFTWSWRNARHSIGVIAVAKIALVEVELPRNWVTTLTLHTLYSSIHTIPTIPAWQITFTLAQNKHWLVLSSVKQPIATIFNTIHHGFKSRISPILEPGSTRLSWPTNLVQQLSSWYLLKTSNLVLQVTPTELDPGSYHFATKLVDQVRDFTNTSMAGIVREVPSALVQTRNDILTITRCCCEINFLWRLWNQRIQEVPEVLSIDPRWVLKFLVSTPLENQSCVICSTYDCH